MPATRGGCCESFTGDEPCCSSEASRDDEATPLGRSRSGPPDRPHPLQALTRCGVRDACCRCAPRCRAVFRAGRRHPDASMCYMMMMTRRHSPSSVLAPHSGRAVEQQAHGIRSRQPAGGGNEVGQEGEGTGRGITGYAVGCVHHHARLQRAAGLPPVCAPAHEDEGWQWHGMAL